MMKITRTQELLDAALAESSEGLLQRMVRRTQQITSTVSASAAKVLALAGTIVIIW